MKLKLKKIKKINYCLNCGESCFVKRYKPDCFYKVK